MREQFRLFLSGLPDHHYCLDCLCLFYGEDAITVAAFLAELNIRSETRECWNCTKVKQTFRAAA